MDEVYFNEPLNTDQICRVCLSESNNLSSIFNVNQEVDDFSSVSEKLSLCGSISVDHQDGLPSLICDVCIYKASIAYEFRQLCQNSDTRLRSYYNKPLKHNKTDSSTQTNLPEDQIDNCEEKLYVCSIENPEDDDLDSTEGSEEVSPTTRSSPRKLKPNEEAKFKCQICTKAYNTQKGLKKHSMVHEKNFKCETCHKSFYTEDNLSRHKIIHASKPHACQLCHSSFSKPEGLVRHLKTHTEKTTEVQELNSMEEPKQELKTEITTEDLIVDEFENAPELFKCDSCNQYCSSMKNLKRHSLVHGEKKYSCTVCKKWYFRADSLKKHAEKHGHGLLDNLIEDNKLYASDEESENLDKKVESEDEACSSLDSSYKCQHCDKVMNTKQGLRRHLTMHKPKAEAVVCDICKKVCASQARLILHQRTHKPKEKVAREYLCHICSKVYPSNSSLTYHMRTHTGIKPHVCKTCNSGFTTTTSLANHIRIHTGDKPFVCHVCSAAFAVSSAFRRHLTRHTGEANYRCETCGKAFKRLSTLKEHSYTHSGEKPYVCKTCGAAYSHSGSLFAHQKRCRVHFGDIAVENQHHHAIIHHVHHVNNNVQSTTVRPVAVIGQLF